MSQFRTLAKIPKFDLQLISDNNFFLAPHFVTKSESRTQLDDPVTRGKVCYAEGLLYDAGTYMFMVYVPNPTLNTSNSLGNFVFEV